MQEVVFKNGELEKLLDFRISNSIGLISEKFSIELTLPLENRTNLRIGVRNRAFVIVKKDLG
jgi:hypothetical protein